MENGKKIMIMSIQLVLLMEKLSNRIKQDGKKGWTAWMLLPIPPGLRMPVSNNMAAMYH